MPAASKRHRKPEFKSHDSPTLWTALLEEGVKEDGWPWDWTSFATGDGDRAFRARIVAKAEGVWASEGLIAATNEVARRMMGGSLPDVVKSRIKNGDALKRGSVVAEWSGPARVVLALERPFLNLASYAGGIATATRELVEKARRACPERPPRVTATRKTLPHYRDIAVNAVIAGGGFSHRVSLAGGVLIKENHVAAAGGIARAIEGARGIAPHGLKIETEVRSISELREAISARADGVLLDNFTPAEVRKAVAIAESAAKRLIIEVSGGITAATISEYAIEGVDLISVGSLTHSVKALDLSLLAEGL